MKKKLLVGLAIGMMFGVTGVAKATPYTGADITLNGYNFSNSSSGPYNSDNWYRNGDAIFTNWAGLWVEYTVALTSGNWNIGLNAINHGNLGPDTELWYPEFDVSFQVKNNPTFDSEIKISASDSIVNNGYVNINIATDDTYTFRYTWLNDKYWPAIYRDANIQINSGFFDKITPNPEPATMLLFGTGIASLAGARLKRKKQ